MGDKPPSTELYEQNSQHQTHTHTHTLRLHLRHHDHTQTRPRTHWQTPHAHNTHTHNTLSVRHHTQPTETTYARKSHQIADTTALLRTYEKASEHWFVFDKMQTQIDSDKRLRASELFLESIGAFREATCLGHHARLRSGVANSIPHLKTRGRAANLTPQRAHSDQRQNIIIFFIGIEKKAF